MLGVLNAIERESGSWGVQLAETLRYALMLLALVGLPLTELERLFYDQGFLYRCIEDCDEPSVSAFWGRFAELSNDKKSALATPVTNKVSLLLATGTLRGILGHPAPLDLGAHLNTPGNVTLVSLAADQTHGAGRMMGNILLTSICREIFARVDIPESRRVPVRLYVDEFEHFGAEDFEHILAEGRKFGLSLVLAHQTLAQLSTKMRSLILGNVGVKFVFRSGREDGAVLSKDLTGDAKAFDFAEFPTGECAMWDKYSGVRVVEVNQPIVRGGGVLTPAARRFAEAVADHSAPPVSESTRSSWTESGFAGQASRSAHRSAPEPDAASAPTPDSVPEEPPVPNAPGKRPKAKAAGAPRGNGPSASPGASDLEDWLCG